MIANQHTSLCLASICLCVNSAIGAERPGHVLPDTFRQPYGAFNTNGGSQYTPEFRKLAAEGLSQIALGDLEAGIATLIRASKVRLEVNFELWDEIAQAKCHEGDYVAGRSLFKEYRCAVNMTVNEVTCYYGDGTWVPNSALTPLCFRMACGDGWEPRNFRLGGQSEGDAPYHDDGTKELRRIDKLVKSCHAPAPAARRK